jgi:2,4-dienoyl-CoA reductase-like NADH-dependent reductase (Old Yellow Enzyme family)
MSATLNGSAGEPAVIPDPFAPAMLGRLKLRNRIVKAAASAGRSRVCRAHGHPGR